LSFKLLTLTIISIMVVEVLIFVPSVAKFRADYLKQRIAAAQIAALSLTEAANGSISPELEKTLLETAGVEGVVLDLGDRAELILQGGMPTNIVARYSVDDRPTPLLVRDAWETLQRGGEALVEVRGEPVNRAGISIAVVLSESDLFNAMLAYGRNIFWLSLLISLITGALIYLALLWLIIRPVWRMSGSMERFRDKPDDPSRIIAPTARRDEMGMLEREMARLQTDLHKHLGERRRLALLGEAVSKINHDLRNILASAQLSSERLRRVEDPQIKAMSGRLVTAIDRAIALCERTLKYGKADEPPPDLQPVALRILVDEVGASLAQGYPIAFVNAVPEEFRLRADPDQLFRMLLNLGRNAAQALQTQDSATITVSAAAQRDGRVDLRIADNGPGLPLATQKTLFTPFSGSHSKGGTGLGLAIVAELMTAHGGEAVLEKSDAQGATFRLLFPAGSALSAPARRRAG